MDTSDTQTNHITTFFSRGSATGGNPSQGRTRCWSDAAGSWDELQTTPVTATETTDPASSRSFINEDVETC